jgi:hypothetical protein
MNTNNDIKTVGTFTYSTDVTVMSGQRGDGKAGRDLARAQEAAFTLAHAAAWERGQVSATDDKGNAIVQQGDFAKLIGWSAGHVNKACTLIRKHPNLSALVGRDNIGKVGRLVVKDDDVVPMIVAVVNAALLVGRAGIGSMYDDLKVETETPDAYSMNEDVARLFKRAARKGIPDSEVIAAVLAEAEARAARPTV